MKKIVVFAVFALSCIFPVAGGTLFAQEAKVEELTRKVKDLEKALAVSEDAMLEIIEKNMGIISKLRSENRELAARVKELEAALAQPTRTPARKSIYDSAKDGMKEAKQENSELSIDSNAPFDVAKADDQKAYPKAKKEAILSNKNSDETAAPKTKKEPEKKETSIWDSIFPF